MTEAHFIAKKYSKTIEKGTVSWQAPSNIALVKYWGKYGEQLPKNPSISFTLTNCYTRTSLSFERYSCAEVLEHKIKKYNFEFYLDGK
jgi:diphosphomevalonate decarboxylase